MGSLETLFRCRRYQDTGPRFRLPRGGVSDTTIAIRLTCPCEHVTLQYKANVKHAETSAIGRLLSRVWPANYDETWRSLVLERLDNLNTAG